MSARPTSIKDLPQSVASIERGLHEKYEAQNHRSLELFITLMTTRAGEKIPAAEYAEFMSTRGSIHAVVVSTRRLDYIAKVEKIIETVAKKAFKGQPAPTTGSTSTARKVSGSASATYP